MKANNEKLQKIITEMLVSANDADSIPDAEYGTDTIERWKNLLSSLETVHYMCMDARAIVRRRIKSAQRLIDAREKKGA